MIKVALCCIAKQENEYIREYVEYYKNLGIDKIFINDNNDVDGERFEDVISDYINSGFVEIIDLRGKIKQQMPCYQYTYMQHANEFDWMCFFDCDEFLVLDKKYKNIKDYLGRKMFDEYGAIYVNWKLYDDNGMLDTDGRPVLERLTHPADGQDIENGGNSHVKTIARTKKPLLWVCTPHVPIPSPYYGVKVCNASGTIILNTVSPFQKINHKDAYVKHFSMKTIGEYCRGKMAKGTYPDRDPEDAKRHLTLTKFFELNTWTKEKEDYANKVVSQGIYCNKQ